MSNFPIIEPQFKIAEERINAEHSLLGGDNGILGEVRKEIMIGPGGDQSGILNECSDKIGYFKLYKHGVIYWTPSTGAHEVNGKIEEKWSSMKAERSVLGYPIEDQGKTPDGVGSFSRFQNGMIYWTPSTGAHEIHGPILDKWSAMGFEQSVLGYPIEDQGKTPDGVGSFSRFQNGMIYWTPSTGAHEIHGPILDKWSAMGFEQSVLGYPIEDQGKTPDGVGSFSRFQNGMIYYAPLTAGGAGAHEVHGAILEKWASMGFEGSYLGYPISDEEVDGSNKRNRFTNGKIIFSPSSNEVNAYPDSITFETGDIRAGNSPFLKDDGWASLVLNSNGIYHFKVHMHSGTVIGAEDFIFSVGVKAKDKDGNNIWLAFAKTGTVGGSDIDTDDIYFDQRIIDFWSSIKECGFRIQPYLHVSTNAGDLVAGIIEILGTVFTFGILLLMAANRGPDVICTTDETGNERCYNPRTRQ